VSDIPPLDPDTPFWRRRSGVVTLLVVAVLAAALAWYFWPSSTATTGTAAKEARKDGKGAGKGKGGGAGGAGDPNRPQPVAVAAARIADMNIVQTALGTVTSGRTAVVRPRVDGLLQSVGFTEGQLVRANDALAQIDPVPFQVALAQTEGQLARDAAQLNNARLDLDRYKTLLTQDSIASQQVDQQAALVRQLEGTVKIDQAQVDNAKLQLSYTRITAPIAGRTGLRLVDPGNMVHTSDNNGLVVITQVDPIAVVYTIPQDALPRVLANSRANRKVPVEAWDREQKNVLAKGELLTADNQIDVATGTVKLKAQFPNPEDKLFPNQFVNIRMIVDVRKNVIVIPTAAVQRNAQGQLVVYVVKEDNTVSVRPIVAGPTEGVNTAIEQGLKEGERVITDGVDRIREGSKVEVSSPETARTAPPAPPETNKKGARGGKEGGEKRGLFKKKSE
jgi:multidrug efflux system membrane fusion protein